jgi:hypothetical protein
MRNYILAALLVLPITSFAGSFVSILGPSYHTIKIDDSNNRVLNNNTYGLAYGYSWNNDNEMRIGGYFNSYRKPTFFVEYNYTPFHIAGIDIGAGVGLATGYKDFSPLNSPIIPMAGLLARYNNVELRFLPYTGIKHCVIFNISYNIHF